MKAKTRPEPPRAQDLTSDQKRAIYLLAGCTQCGAAKHMNCRIPSGKVLWPPHAARMAAASAAGRIAW